MSLTERIITTVEQGRKLGVTDDELDGLLIGIGCTRVVHFADTLIVYYVDEGGQERFVVIGP